MVLEIRLTNFYSIKEEVVLDLQAANINNKNAKRLEKNFFKRDGKKVLKSVAIYGANASGKSNIIQAIRLCLVLVLRSHNFNEDVDLHLKPFKFNSGKELSIFFIRFVDGSVEYEYAFEVNLHKNIFVKERLYHYPNGRRAKIFDRDEDRGQSKREKYSFGQGIRRPFDVAENTSNRTLYLSRASQMDRHFAKQLYNYFDEKFILAYSPPWIKEDMPKSYLKNEDAKRYLLEGLKAADSDIVDIQYQTEGEQTIRTFHKSDPNVAFDFEEEESGGTKKLFSILLDTYQVLKDNKIFLIDEIETHLHPKVVEYILELFHDSEQSQLIFSTHNTKLLDLEKMRKDQIYFVNKKKDASSDLYSLYDYSDFRETMDLEKAYLQGRFDAVPLI